MYVVESDGKGSRALPARELSGSEAKALGSELAERIVKALSEKPMYPSEIAKNLHVHEQKVYYHIRKLQDAGIIRIEREDIVAGALARYYSLTSPAFVVRYSEMRSAPNVIQAGRRVGGLLDSFVKDGKLDAKIVVGSPDPHGPEMNRARDGHYAIDLAMFLGTMIDSADVPHVMLDTEVKASDLKENLILIGGPLVNNIVSEVNSSLPIRFDPRSKWNVVSRSGKEYLEDEAGIIVKAPNPYNRVKRVLVVAGKRNSGTRAAVCALLKHFEEISEGNKHDKNVPAHVVIGLDRDSDGRIDDAEIME